MQIHETDNILTISVSINPAFNIAITVSQNGLFVNLNDND